MEQLEEVEVRADYDPEVTGPFLPEVEGTRINAGRKTSNIVLKELPEISNDNFRQVLATTPGVILAEESTPLLSIGYRGYDPHRTQYFQVLEDGIPIHADMFRAQIMRLSLNTNSNAGARREDDYAGPAAQ